MTDYYKVGVEAFDSKFEFLTGDMCWEDHGGKWFRRVSPTCFQVVEIFKWEEVVGERESAEMPTYHVELAEIDISLDPSGALGTSGFYIDDEGNIATGQGDILAEHDDEERKSMILVECLYGHGNKAHMGQWDGDKYEELFRLALEDAESYADHGDAYEEIYATTLACRRPGCNARPRMP